MSLEKDQYLEIIYQLLNSSQNLGQFRQSLDSISLVNKEFHSILQNPQLIKRLFYSIVPEEFRIEREIHTLYDNFTESIVYYNHMVKHIGIENYLNIYYYDNLEELILPNLGLKLWPILLLENQKSSLKKIDVSHNHLDHIDNIIYNMDNLRELKVFPLFF